MADDPAKSPHAVDVATIKELAAVMSQHDLSEIVLRREDLRLRLRRGPRQAIVGSPPVAYAPGSPPPAAASPVPAPAAKQEPAKPAKQLLEIKSPTPGTFYAAANPETPPFVRVGSRVTPETVVCLIEAMKLFNEVTADCAGVIAEVLVENQQPVEWGTVLFRVDPGG